MPGGTRRFSTTKVIRMNKPLIRYFYLTTFLLLAGLLAGCAKATPVVIPTLAVTPPTGSAAAGGVISGSPADGVVVASAEVAPARVAEIGFASAGFVRTIAVQEGDTVQAGDRLAELSNLEELQAVVDASQQSLDSAQKALQTLNENAPLALANAQMAVVQNQKRYNDAVKYQKTKDLRRCSKDTLDLYRTRFDQAKERLEDAENDNDGSLSALERVTEAQNVFNTAQANYVYCMGYTEQEIAEWNAELAVSEAALQQSTEYYAMLQKEQGIDPDEVSRLNAAIAAAQASLVTAKSALERAVILSPLAGTVIQINITSGQAVTPGQPAFVLANLSPLQVVTTDLSERDINRVKVGQSVDVTIDALGQSVQGPLPGKVIKIDPRASKIGGDVVYKVTIALDEQPENLRWGMKARVEIKP
jgi:HlyD family secretion protein